VELEVETPGKLAIDGAMQKIVTAQEEVKSLVEGASKEIMEGLLSLKVDV
jgi:hypothetical protein